MSLSTCGFEPQSQVYKTRIGPLNYADWKKFIFLNMTHVN